MNEHVQRAKVFLAIAESGDSKKEAYRMAAEEVAAAVADGATRVRVATLIGKHPTFVGQLLKWRDGGYETDTPWLADKGATTRAAVSHTRAILRDAPMEQVERIIDELPDERKVAIKAAFGEEYNRSLQGMRDEQHEMSQRERDEREAAASSVGQALASSTLGFTKMEIVTNIKLATESLRQLISDQVMTPETWEEVRAAINELLREGEVAAAMLGLDYDVQEV